MRVWIVGRIRDPERWREWEMMGVFGSHAAAVAACTRQLDFVQPYTLNERAPDAITSATGGEYPRILDADPALPEALARAMEVFYETHEGTDPVSYGTGVESESK